MDARIGNPPASELQGSALWERLTIAARGCAKITTVIGPYLLSQGLGMGASGAVFRARRGTEPEVALKIVRPVDEADLVRVRREIDFMRLLRHEHIVSILNDGEHVGLVYFATPLASNGTLAHRIESSTTLEVREAALVGRDIARALAYAHKYGVVHRDVKPSNVLLYGSTAALADFGTAKGLEDATLTRERAAIGTLAYMSPEQLRGERERIDGRSDVYGLGATLFHALAGEPPFQGEDRFAIERAILELEAPPLRSFNRDVPAAVEAIVARCLEKDMEDRPARVADVSDDLDRWLSGGPVRLRPLGPLARLRRRRRRHPVAFRAVLIALASISALIVIGALRLAASEARLASARSQSYARFLESLAEQALASERPDEAVVLSAMVRDRAGEQPEGASVIEERNRARIEDGVRRGHFVSRTIARHDADGPIPLIGAAILRRESDDPSRPPQVVTAARDGAIEMWEHRASAPGRTLTVKDDVAAFAASSRASLVAAATVQGRVFAIDAGPSSAPEELSGEPATITALTVSDDGATIAAAFLEQAVLDGEAFASRIVIWTRTAETSRWVERSAARGVTLVSALHVLPDGRLTLGFRRGGAAILEPNTGASRALPLSGRSQHGTWPRSFAFDPRHRRLAVGLSDDGVEVLPLDGSEPWAEGGAAFRVSAEIGVAGVAFSRDGSVLAAGSASGRSFVWQPSPFWGGYLSSSALCAAFGGHDDAITSVALSPDGGWLITSSADGSARTWDLRSNRARAQVSRRDQKIAAAVTARSAKRTFLAWQALRRDSRDARTVVTVVDADTLTQLAEIEVNESFPSSLAAWPQGDGFALALADDSVVLYVERDGRWERTARIRDIGGEIDLAADGSSILVGGPQGLTRIRLPEGPAGRVGEATLITPIPPDREIMKLACAPEGDRVAITQPGRRASIIDGRSGRTVRSWSVQHRRDALALAWSRNGRLLATGAEDETAVVCDASNGEAVRAFAARAPVWALAFADDDRVLVTAGKLGHIALWDIASGRRSADLRGFPSGVTSLALRPGDPGILAAGNDDTARLFHGREAMLGGATKGAGPLSIEELRRLTGAALRVADSIDEEEAGVATPASRQELRIRNGR